MVQLLNGLDGDVDIVGAEPVDGVDATHYRFGVSLDAVLDSLDGDARDVMADLLDALDLGTLDVDVWLDDDGRVLRFQTVVDVDGEPVTVTIGYSDFGSEVDIRIPEASAALSSEEFELATADVSGAGWTGRERDRPDQRRAWYAEGPARPRRARFALSAQRQLRQPRIGQRLAPDRTGHVDRDLTMSRGTAPTPRPDRSTTPGGYHETAEYTWTVSDAADGMATEFTEVGTIHGEITAAGRADGCTFDGSPGGNVTGDATVEGTATRT